MVPKKEEDRIFDMDEDDYLSLMKYARKIARGVEKAVPCERVGMTVIGLEVPHVHVHLIPLHNMDDANFSKKERLRPEEFREIADEIKKNLK